MSVDPFTQALENLNVGEWGLYGPISFIDYCESTGVKPSGTTVSNISVDFHSELKPSLRSHNAMVFRLGPASKGRGSKFAIVGTPGRLDDFFLFDERIFDGTSPRTFLSEASFRDLFPYYIFPKLTEKAYVNLAFASGLIGYALGLDKPYPTAAPVTGNSVYSFSFRAHSEAEFVLDHGAGQVEVDAVFVGKRNGSDCVFFLETKTGSHKTLAKHKLVYPILSLAPRIPRDLQIVPVYMKATTHEGHIRYDFVECELPDPRESTVSIDMLRPVSHKAVSFPITRLV